MFKEKIIIAPAPILRALRDNQLALKSLLEPEKLLSILSTRDVIFYYALNVMLCKVGFHKSAAAFANKLTEALAQLPYFSNGIMDVFTQEEWVKFASTYQNDIQAELSTLNPRAVYEYATGEPYDVEAHRSGDAVRYEFKTTVLNADTVCIMVVPCEDACVTDSMLSQRLMRDVLYSMNTISAKPEEYKSLYVGLCSSVVNNAIAQRRV
ncbi:hypothetical protein pEaSNUABM37_00357 [Erwinia phage pEa_SNUABM_37]|nr:hypothetical protein pEaSNUABM37_00357 [Erwinia phage pEa_SNUABM_37]QXO10825.1 hypothetical protein pEaSNUABM48_00357 [Erwinia phage pEa_SNUABM_48]